MTKHDLQQIAARINTAIAHSRELINRAAEEASLFNRYVSAMPEDMNPPPELPDKVWDAGEQAEIGRRQALEQAQSREQMADVAADEVIKAVEKMSPEMAQKLRELNASRTARERVIETLQTPQDDDIPKLASQSGSGNVTDISKVQVMKEGWLERIYGQTGVVYKYFGPKAVVGGRGKIEPTNDNLYAGDLTNMSGGSLLKWPEGFYRNKATSGLQYLVKQPGLLVTIDFHAFLTDEHNSILIYTVDETNPTRPATAPHDMMLPVLTAALPTIEQRLLRIANS